MTLPSRPAAVLLGLAALAAAAPAASADPFPAGDSVHAAAIRGAPTEILAYRPPACRDPSLLVVFADRDAGSALGAAKALADRACHLVVAPDVGPAPFGGVSGPDGTLRDHGDWAVHLVPAIVAWARAAEGRPAMPYSLWGFGEGGRFVSRAAAMNAAVDARRIVVGAPDDHFLASMGQYPAVHDRPPYGYTGMPGSLSPAPLLLAYLAAPVTIYVGLRDTGQDRDLSLSVGAAGQGENRRERGEFAFRVARAVAQANGWTFRWRLTYADCGHSEDCMLRAPEAAAALAPAAAGVSVPCGGYR